MQISKFHDKKLFEAVKSGQLVAAKSALASGANPNVIDPATHMPLIHFCAASKRFDLMRALFESRAEVGSRDREGRTLVRRCVEDGLPEGVKIALAQGADLSESDSVGDSLLHSACARGRKGHHYFDIAKTLIDAGALLTHKNQRGETPMHHAARYGGDRMARFMAGLCDLEAKDLDGHAPIHAAALGIDNEAGVMALIDAKAPLGARDRNGQTPLHLIAAKPKTRPTDISVARMLIGAGASLWARDREGMLAYEVASAAFTQHREVHQELIRLLKPKGVEPEAPPPEDERPGSAFKAKGKGRK